MGPPTGLTAAVADAGPLIHLSEIGCLPLLDLFEAILVPDAVWSEAVGRGAVSGADLSKLNSARRVTLDQDKVTRFVADRKLESLHVGERECLYACHSEDVSVILTDDLDVRDVARVLKLTPVGSLGLLVRAHVLGQVSLADAERYIADLQEVSSLFVTRAIVEEAIEQLRRRAAEM